MRGGAEWGKYVYEKRSIKAENWRQKIDENTVGNNPCTSKMMEYFSFISGFMMIIF